jgi:hypothetical protein
MRPSYLNKFTFLKIFTYLILLSRHQNFSLHIYIDLCCVIVFSYLFILLFMDDRQYTNVWHSQIFLTGYWTLTEFSYLDVTNCWFSYTVRIFLPGCRTLSDFSDIECRSDMFVEDIFNLAVWFCVFWPWCQNIVMALFTVQRK